MWLRRYSRLFLGLLVVGGLLGVALWPSATAVDVVAVSEGPLTVTVDEAGTTRVRDRFIVSAPVAGRLARIELEPGDAVERGRTRLARLTAVDAPLLDPRTRAEFAAAAAAADAVVGQAQAERARVQTTLARARGALRRQEDLMKAGAIASDTLENAQTGVAALGDELRAADFAVSRAMQERQVARARLQSPASTGRMVDVVAAVDGVILRRLHQSETVVPIGEPLLEIGDPSRIEVVADLLSSDAVRTSVGSLVYIDEWGGPEPLTGRVRRIEPAGFMKVSALGVEEQRVNVVIDVEHEDRATRLGDGYRVEVRLVTWHADRVRKVPVGALFRRGTQWAAFTVDGDRARLRPVQLGQQSNSEAQVVSGLESGQQVVLHPPDTLTDNARVVIRAEAP